MCTKMTRLINWRDVNNLTRLINWRDVNNLTRLINWRDVNNLTRLINWRDVNNLTRLINWRDVNNLTRLINLFTCRGYPSTTLSGSKTNKMSRGLSNGYFSETFYWGQRRKQKASKSLTLRWFIILKFRFHKDNYLHQSMH